MLTCIVSWIYKQFRPQEADNIRYLKPYIRIRLITPREETSRLRSGTFLTLITTNRLSNNGGTRTVTTNSKRKLCSPSIEEHMCLTFA